MNDPIDPYEDDTLDPEDERELDGGDAELTDRLRTLFGPSTDIRDRAALDVDRALRGRSVLASGFELLGLGLWTAQALLSDAPAAADQDREGN